MPKASTFPSRLASQMIDSDTFPMLTNAGENARLPVSEARQLLGLVGSSTINAYNEVGATREIKIQAAINRAISTGATRVFVPSSMYPYDAALVTFDPSVQMVREGGSFDVYDVQAYGASGDGATDALAGIQAAIDNAPDGEAILVSPAAVEYKTTDTIHITGRSKLHIIGISSGAKIKAATPTFDAFLVDITSDRITFDGLTVQGASVATESFTGIRSSASRTIVRNCEVYDFNIGIFFWVANWYAGYEFCKATDNYIHDLVGNSSGNGYGVYTVCPHTIISRNRFSNVPRHDVYTSGSDLGANYSVIEGNISTGGGFQAIAIYQTSTWPAMTGITVIGNTLKDCVIGIRCDANVRSCSITGNIIENATGASIQLDGGVLADEQLQGIIISSNAIHNSQFDQPILLTNASRSIVSNNTIHSDGGLNGIQVTSAGPPIELPTGNQISGNTIWGQTSNAIVIDATCIGTVVGTNFYETVSSIGNERDVITYNDTSTPVAIDLKGYGGIGRPIFIIFNQAGVISVTNFTNCREGQEIICYFQTASVTTITSANAWFVGGGNFASTQLDTLGLILRGTNWFETHRSVI